MLVRNIEPRLIRVGGEFIAPNQTVELADDAVGLKELIQRGVLMPVSSESKKDKSKKQE